MNLFRFTAPALTALLLSATPLQAHFIFAVVEQAEGNKVVKLYFGDQASDEDSSFLKNIENVKPVILGGRGEPKPVELKLEADKLTGQIPENSHGPIVMSQNYGVMGKGDKVYNLVYHAKAYQSELPAAWEAVENTTLLPLELESEIHGNDVKFTVKWQGQPAAGSKVSIESPALDAIIEGETDEAGVFKTSFPKSGLYSARARHIDQTPGEVDGKAYAESRHFSTVVIPFTTPEVKLAEKNWPELVKGSTSFGAAIVGDDLYTYGGNYGGGHQYSEEDQSGDFRKLSLSNPTEWVDLEGGPKLTGLAMVAYNGNLYRIGGFTVKEVEGEKPQLNSQDSFAVYNVAEGKWHDLTPLPEPRSSHDAVVIGNTLYVVGGWSMVGSDGQSNHGWLKSAYSYDLSQDNSQWVKLPDAPFERRAISAAAFEGKLYVLGGMQQSGGVTTQVAVFDPETQSWTEAPHLKDGGMDGFGTASFVMNGKLYTTTMSGSIQVLEPQANAWKVVGQLNSPRFFHEVAPWNNGLVVVGGASMSSGKATSIEFVEPITE